MVLIGQAMIDAADAFAERAHAGQTRRDKKTPSITHPRAVARLFFDHWWQDASWYRYTVGSKDSQSPMYYECDRGVALSKIHDVKEDSDFQWKDFVAAGLGDLVDMAAILTRGTDQSYLQYILNIRDYKRISPLPFLVKLCDMEHNLSDAPTKAQCTKYELARYILLS